MRDLSRSRNPIYPLAKSLLSGKMARMIKALAFFLFFLFAGSFNLAFPASQEYPVYVGDPEKSEQGACARAFKKYVEKKTAGQIRLRLFYSSQLGDETEAFHNVRSGAMPFAIGTIANLAPFDKRLAILTLPYLFLSQEDAIVGTSGKAAELLEAYATESGFRVLCWTLTDFRYISNSRRPIRRLADMAGLKFRVPQSAVFISTYKALGALPAPIAWGETFTALQQGVVDGQCYGYIGFLSMKFLDAKQKWLTEAHYTYQIQPLVMSEVFFQSLAPDLQRLFLDAGRSAREEALQYLEKNRALARQDLIGQGLEISPLEDEDKWMRIAYANVWPAVVMKVGGYEAIKKYFRSLGKELPEAFQRALQNSEVGFPYD